MNAHRIDPTELAVEAAPPEHRRRRRPPTKVFGLFLRGPVPWSWLMAAARLRGRALHVGLVLWQRAWWTRNMFVSLSLSATAKEIGCDRSSASRALSELAKAGLVVVTRASGRNVEVEIVEAGGSEVTSP